MIRRARSVQLNILRAAFLTGIVVLLGSNFASAKLEDDIRARISPLGEVCIMGEDCALGVAMAGSASQGPKDPQVVYETYCFACHGSGVNDSPVLGDVAAWEPRIGKGMDALYDSALNGFNNNAMPARGLCMDCSDDDIRATVDFLVETTQ